MAIVTCPKCGAKNRVDETRAAELQPVCGKCGTKLPVPGQADARDASHPIAVTDDSFARDVLGAGARPVLVDAWAPWCGPCRMIAPTLDQLAAESAGRYTIAKLNVDENPRTAAEYRIEGIPTLLLFKNGKLVDRIVGLAPKPTIAQKLAALT
jgi:thioredoxin 2